MRKTALCWFLALALATPGFSGVEEAVEKFKELCPWKGVEISEIREFKVPGMYEVVVRAGKGSPLPPGSIIYFHPGSGVFFVGEVFDSSGRSLTRKRVIESMRARIESLDLSPALKVGNGPVKVIEFTDPECPYCRMTERFLEKNSKYLTRYLVFYPLPFHRRAKKEALYLICKRNSPDLAGEVKRVYSGEIDALVDNNSLSFEDCDLDGAAKVLSEHVDMANTVGVRGTPFLYIEGYIVPGADLSYIARVISAVYEKKTGKKADITPPKRFGRR